MCGIFGCVGKKMSLEKVKYCCNTLIHRGPDGYGIWQGKNVSLAHRRLSIFDLTENGHQPMTYANGRYWIIFNGEIYNYIEIKKELVSKGYKFISNTDTEVILAAYCEWKENCLGKFNGMWSFAIYDSLLDKLFMSRDRFGVKPLYYYLQDNYLIFASEMKAIMPCLDEVKANQKLIEFYKVFHHYEFKEECLIQNIKRFPAGCYAIYENKHLKIKKYWETLDNLLEVPHDYFEQAEMFKDLFIDACKLRMRSDVSIGTSLSGGLDSSAVICAMNAVANNGKATFQRDWQHAYVAGFKNSLLDETIFAQKVIDYIDTESTLVEIKNNLDEDKLYLQAYLFEELWMNSQIPQMCIYEAEKKNGTKVSIDGHGADELFGGYGFNMQFALLNVCDEESLIEIGNALRRTEEIQENDTDLNKWVKLRLKKTKIRNWYERNFYQKLILKKKDIHNVDFNCLDYFTQSLYIETHYRTLQTMLRNYDRDSMANSVEVRMPFMDYRIVSFAYSIPWNSKVRNGFSKSIIRDALHDIMPLEIAYRRDKKGFNAPISEWIRNSAELYLDMVNSTSFFSSNIIRNPSKVRKRLYNFIYKYNNNYLKDFHEGQQLWLNLNLFIWEQAMLKEHYIV